MSASENDENLCNHIPCRCEVPPGQDYCSDYCREEPTTGLENRPIACRCRHEPCGTPADPGMAT